MKNELPIRSKVTIVNHIGEILIALHDGDFSDIEPLIEQLKLSSLRLEDPIQHDVLMFSEAVLFQKVYDPAHRITREVQGAADRLIEDLGFVAPKG